MRPRDLRPRCQDSQEPLALPSCRHLQAALGMGHTFSSALVFTWPPLGVSASDVHRVSHGSLRKTPVVGFRLSVQGDVLDILNLHLQRTFSQISSQSSVPELRTQTQLWGVGWAQFTPLHRPFWAATVGLEPALRKGHRFAWEQGGEGGPSRQRSSSLERTEPRLVLLRALGSATR